MLLGNPSDGVRTPPVVLAYGVLGLVPFVTPPILGLIHPALSGPAAWALSVYGALILSFLGGARWGQAIRADAPSAWTTTLSMVPTLAGLALLLTPPEAAKLRLLGLAAALILHGVWDRLSPGLPLWYSALRTPLTLVAASGLIAGAAILT